MGTAATHWEKRFSLKESRCLAVRLNLEPTDKLPLAEAVAHADYTAHEDAQLPSFPLS